MADKQDDPEKQRKEESGGKQNQTDEIIETSPQENGNDNDPDGLDDYPWGTVGKYVVLASFLLSFRLSWMIRDVSFQIFV